MVISGNILGINHGWVDWFSMNILYAPETIVFTPTPEVSCKFSLQQFLNHFSTVSGNHHCLSFSFSPYIWNFGVCNWASMLKYQMMYCNDERRNLELYIETSFSSVIPGLLHVWFADDLCLFQVFPHGPTVKTTSFCMTILQPQQQPAAVFRILLLVWPDLCRGFTSQLAPWRFTSSVAFKINGAYKDGRYLKIPILRENDDQPLGSLGGPVSYRQSHFSDWIVQPIIMSFSYRISEAEGPDLNFLLDS